jgi:hypothetical protein
MQQGETIMATQPPQEFPVPDSQPVAPDPAPAEFPSPAPDFDQPSPGIPAGDPGTAQPLQA